MAEAEGSPHGFVERLVAAAIRQRGWVLLVVAFAALGSLWMARRLELDALPDVTGNQVVVLTMAPGLTPSEVERLVTRPIEAALGGLPGLEEQRSLSRYGISSIVLVFDDDVDPWLARQQATERLATLGEMPEGVATPELAPFTGGLGEVFQITLTSREHSLAELYELVRLGLAPQLRAVPGVVEVNAWGGQRRTLDVVADPVRLSRYGMTLAELTDVLRESTGAVAGATLPAGPGQTLLRGVYWPRAAEELRGLGLRSAAMGPDAPPLRLAEIADVREGHEPRIGAATHQGRSECVYVMVQMLRGDNALALMERLHAELPTLRASLPAGVELDIVYDRSELVRRTLRTVAKNLLEGAALVILVLFLMLGSVRAGLIVAAIIPLSMLGAVAGMVFLRVPGNLMSLGAIDFGLLVDGAVVMVERTYHELAGAERVERLRARMTTAMQTVARPMTFSVVVIALVYVPILTLEGVDGKMFRPMAITVVFALITSLVLALTAIPAAVAAWLRPEHVPTREPWLVRAMARLYRPVLERAVRHPVLVLVASLLLLGAGGWAFAQSGRSFVPQLDEGDLVIQTMRPSDVSIETAVREALRLERVVLEAAPEVRSVSSRIGSPEVATDIMGLEQADVFVRLGPRETWREGLTRERLIEEIEHAIESGAPGSEPSFTQPIQMRFNELVGGSVTDVVVAVYGEDIERTRAVAERIQAIVQAVPGATDTRILAPPAVSLLEVRPRLLEAARLGFSTAEVLDLALALRVGIDVGTTWDGPTRIPIRLRLQHGSDAFTLAETMIPTPSGDVVALARIVELVHLETPALVNRHNAQRRVLVGFNVRGAELGDVVLAAQAAVERQLENTTGVRLHWGGQYAQLESARQRLAIVIPAVLLGVWILLLIVFRAFRPAAVIFLNVPFAVVGGILALWSRDLSVSISAAIGFIALSGIAVLNGVVLMSSVLQHERAGRSPAEAALESARERMRPVLMTAMVAALGFLPMALATGVGAEVQRPLATVVVGGLVTSTLLTLLILPSLYPWIAGRRRSREPSPTSPDP